MANTLTFNQVSVIFSEIVAQATGQAPLGEVTTSNFVSVAETALKTGYDPLLSAVSQVLSRTIFSIRPYSEKFKGLEMDEIRFGNHVRKLTAIDKPIEDDSRFKLVEGEHAEDMFDVRKPDVLQTNYYGSNVYQKGITIFRDQLDCAFRDPAEFARFIDMIMTNVTDQLAQVREEAKRGTLANLMGAVSLTNSGAGVLHLVTLYNEFAGTSLTTETVKAPENFRDFSRWLFGFITTMSQRMSERTSQFHANPAGKTIMRHTPVKDQRLYLYAPLFNVIDSSVLSTTFNDEYLKMIDYEPVTYWQSFLTPDSINVDASYINIETGEEANGSAELSNIVGVLFDREAAGVVPVNQWSAATPFEARGGYTNIWYHTTIKNWNDVTENALVMVLD